MTGTRRPHLVLVGMMGSGKTTVGESVARRLRRHFRDSDEMIEARTGRTVREIWMDHGEPAFRRLETSVLLEALADDVPAVVAAAGGSVLAATNRDAIRRGGRAVWLRGSPEVLARRVPDGHHRPLLDEDPITVLRRMYRERLPLYREVADAWVDVDQLRADGAADRVLTLTRRVPGRVGPSKASRRVPGRVGPPKASRRVPGRVGPRKARLGR